MRKFGAVLLSLLFTFLIATPAFSAHSLTVGVGKSALFRSRQIVANVQVGDSTVAGVAKLNTKKLSVIGKSLGRTSITLYNKAGSVIGTINVDVISAGLPHISSTIKSHFPNENVGVEKVNNSLVLSGTVSDAEVAKRITQLSKQYVNKDATKYVNEVSSVVNMMQVKGGQQVMLRVRVGEIQRTALKELGVSLSGTKNAGRYTFPFNTGSAVGAVPAGGAIAPIFGDAFGSAGVGYVSSNFNLTAQLDALEREGLLKVLAEPNLVAISGETANFLAGGEFPIPVQQDNNKAVTIDFKKFGVGVDFTPTVLSQNRIRLTVAPEVSEISNLQKDGAIISSGFNIPAITTRRAKTTVELAPGESFMIAGLIKDNVSTNVDQVPGLGNIPIFSALFRSSSFQRDETELVIAVTPYLVDPVTGSEVRLPTDDFRAASTLETVFFGALGSLSGKSNIQEQIPGSTKLDGSYGFMTE